MEEIVKLIAGKTAEIDNLKTEIEKSIARKASQEEVDALRASLAAVTEQYTRLQEQLNAHAQLIESLQVTKPVTAEKKMKGKFDYKEIASKLKVEKAVTATYAPFTFQDQTLAAIPAGSSPYIHESFLSDSINPSSVLYVDVTNTIDIANSVTQGCFTVTESDISLTAVNATAGTYRGFTDVCDTHLEDYQQLGSTIENLMRTGVLADVDANLIAEFTAKGRPAALTPSWTAAAGSVASCNLHDLLMLHSGDIFEMSKNYFTPQFAFVSPTDYYLLRTKKDNPYFIQGETPLQIIVSTQVPIGSYYVVGARVADVYPVRDLTLEIVSPGKPQVQNGIKTLIASSRFTIVVKNIAYFGVIYGNIAASIANYNQP